MRVIVQRVSSASVTINEKIKSSIGKGLLILAGFESEDQTEEDLAWMAKKIAQLRIFSDENGNMNLSVKDIQGEILVISQFTLYASTKKGNRPSFIKSAKTDIAIPLYEKFIKILRSEMNQPIYTGEFGAMMQIALINDGPVTICMDSKNKE